MEKALILIEILWKTNGFEHQGGSGANRDRKSIASERDSFIYTAAATQRAAGVAIYIGWPLRFYYLHSGSDN